eukprot:TRINITY_DN18408_c0_g1_i1.p1 TRINITY_DN18408_c0_g1~~TRINITY_DN18408_c0_g1_i1.p1  ORF type:complete len:679 (+),score=119.45 TRINITY_DN18408_c0_g1_i1:107-2143(+)
MSFAVPLSPSSPSRGAQVQGLRPPTLMGPQISPHPLQMPQSPNPGLQMPQQQQQQMHQGVPGGNFRSPMQNPQLQVHGAGSMPSAWSTPSPSSRFTFVAEQADAEHDAASSPSRSPVPDRPTGPPTGWRGSSHLLQRLPDIESLRSDSLFMLPLPEALTASLPAHAQPQAPGTDLVRPLSEKDLSLHSERFPPTGAGDIVNQVHPGVGELARSESHDDSLSLVTDDTNRDSIEVSLFQMWKFAMNFGDMITGAWCSKRCVSSPRNGYFNHFEGDGSDPITTWSLKTAPTMQASAARGGDPSPLTGVKPEVGHYERAMGLGEIGNSLASNAMSVCSLKGNKSTSPNQDRGMSAKFSKTGGMQMFGVFDGHGACGHSVAEVCADVMPKIILRGLHRISAAAETASQHPVQMPVTPPAVRNSGPSSFGFGFEAPNPQDAGNAGVATRAIMDIVHASYEEMHHLLEVLTAEAMRADLGTVGSRTDGMRVDARSSGTTATMVMLLPGRRLLLSHVGDSRAVIGTRPRNSPEGAWRAFDITEDHKPSLPGERARIESYGATVVAVGIAPHMTTRVFSQGQTWPSINMSRSLGDLHAHSQGLSCKADVRMLSTDIWDPATEDAVLIVGSDGVWDVLDADRCVEIVVNCQHSDPAGAIAREAHDLWIARNLQGSYADDITALVKYL